MTVHTKTAHKENGPSFQEYQSHLETVLSEFPKLETTGFLQKTTKIIDKLLHHNNQHELTNQLILEALNHVDELEPDWTYVASRLLSQKLQQEEIGRAHV